MLSVYSSRPGPERPEIATVDRPIASWSSRGARWRATLSRVSGGYRIAESKHGNACGAAFRPLGMVPNDAMAIAWAERHVCDCFDVGMIREV